MADALEITKAIRNYYQNLEDFGYGSTRFSDCSKPEVQQAFSALRAVVNQNNEPRERAALQQS